MVFQPHLKSLDVLGLQMVDAAHGVGSLTTYLSIRVEHGVLLRCLVGNIET